MINYKAYHEYVISKQTKLFTAVLLPNENGTFPTVVIRTPYVDNYAAWSDNGICVQYMREYMTWLAGGYAVVVQHCRGRGKSEGDFIPYIDECDDTRTLYEWIRNQSFYNGELFLKGESYLTTVHYCAAPFADDIKGAVFGVQDTERYNMRYRNGFLKKSNWYLDNYKPKAKLKKQYTTGCFETLPLLDMPKTAFGEPAPAYEAIIRSPKPTDPYWSTPEGGVNTKGATNDIKFPALFTTAFYDIYTGGIFDMWKKMSTETRNNCALVISPYDHGDNCNESTGILFPKGKRMERFGSKYEMEWFDHIREGKPSPFEKGKVTYYSLFENCWRTDDFKSGGELISLPLGEESVTYTYNPFDPPRFKGGLSINFGGSAFQDKPNSRYDIISVYTKPFEADTFVKGKMTSKLCVSSDCEDTCFYMRVSIEKERGDFGLRDDITSLCYQLGDYVPNTVAYLDFNFDEHAFLIKKGERLRIDIASANAGQFVRHTNQKGLYCEQTTAKIAHNTVNLKDSVIILPKEN